MAVDRGNLTPSPAPEPKLPVGRFIIVKTMRGGLTPPNQASTTSTTGTDGASWNQGIESGG